MEKKGFWTSLAIYAPIFTALIAAIGLVYGISNVDKQINLNSEIKAIELYKEYTNNVEDNQRFIDTTFTFNPKNWNTNYILFAHYALFISESLYSLRKGDKAWENTLSEYILFPHIPFYEYNVSVDDAIKNEFKIFYKSTVNNFYEETKRKPYPTIGD